MPHALPQLIDSNYLLRQQTVTATNLPTAYLICFGELSVLLLSVQLVPACNSDIFPIN